MIDPYAIKRHNMVERFVKARGVTDERTLAAMREVPRHLFVESALADRAYEDHPTPIGNGQTISQPYIVGLFTQAAGLTGAEKTLEVGTGSGYQTAILAKLADRVYTIERINDLSNRARKIFNRLGYKNIVCLVGDGTGGAKKFAPFDVIVVTAGSPSIPVPLARQLVDGGRMVIPVGEGNEQTLHIVRREGERFKVTRKEECTFVPLIGQHGWKNKPAKY